MKRLVPFVLLLFFLIACAEEFPPNPPPPGERDLAGKAVGGISISPGALPKWAAEIKNTDITPTQVKIGDTVTVTVTKPASVKTKFYAHAIAYAYNKKFKFWEKVFADTSKSGKIIKTWAEDKATFNVPISTDRFLPGPNYVVIYWCIDTEKRDSKGFKIWDCQGNKWQLGAFEMLGGSYPDILIEKDIENNRYKSSVKADLPAGAAYTANYETLTGVKTEVTVLQLKNVDDAKKELAKSIVELEPRWTKRGNVCGFLSAAAGQVTFGWLSGSNWLTVKTYANTADDAKIGVYGIKYPSDCNLFDTLRGIAPPASLLCGNNKVDSPEACDGTDDSACPGACRPDCSCMATGDANFGFCGDNIIEKPNKDGVTEDCEPPGSRDPVTGQLISSACFLRNTLGQITGTGACDDKCKCIAGTFTKSACGDGKGDPGEQCGDPGTAGCAAGNMCVNCKCWAVPLTCGNGAKDVGEQCDPGKPGVACPAGQTCSGNCLCVKKAKCGNGVKEAGEQCEKATDCPNGLPGTFKACLACGCAYFGWPIGGCGDGDVDKAGGEECEADKDCANPVGGIVSPLCNKNTCKCNKVCGDGKISSPNDDVPPKNEQCDPPGRIGPCPPIRMIGGGCAIPLCKDDCTCPSGEPCEQQGGQCPQNGGKDCPPVSGITMGENTGYTGTGTFYTLGTRYPTFDTTNTQCGEVCVADVVAQGAVDTDGSDVTKDGTCYYVSGMAIAAGTVAAQANVITSTIQPAAGSNSYTITGVKSRCISSTQISEPVVAGAKCEERALSCPANTQCQTTSSGAACVSITGPPLFTQECADTDGGWNLLTKGIVTMLGSVRCTDRCATSLELQNSQGRDQLFECFCGNKVGSGGGQGSGWTSCPEGTSCSNGACVPLTMSSSTSAHIVEGTRGCTASSANCFTYYTGTSQAQACSGCYNACCVTYSCASSGELVDARTPAGCTGQFTGGFVTGQAIFTEDIGDVASSKGVQIALFLIAAMGILVITLLNFAHKEQ